MKEISHYLVYPQMPPTNQGRARSMAEARNSILVFHMCGRDQSTGATHLLKECISRGVQAGVDSAIRCRHSNENCGCVKQGLHCSAQHLVLVFSNRRVTSFKS